VGKEAKVGAWKGIEFISNIIDYHPKLKGLQTSIAYLTLPDSPFLLIKQSVINRSETLREIYTEITATLEKSDTIEDNYWIKSRNLEEGIIRFHTQEFESYSRREMKYSSKWCVFNTKDSSDYIGMISVPSSVFDQVAPYTPNKSYVSLNRLAAEIKIPPGKTNTNYTFFIVANSLDEIYPFVHSNVEDLFN
jgi:hypothetical protein